MSIPANLINPAQDIVPLVVGKVNAQGGLYVGTEGPFTFITAAGNTRTETLTAGYHPIQIIELISGTGVSALVQE
jgi:hypothetical protein